MSKWAKAWAREQAGISVYPVSVGPEVIEALLQMGMPEADSRDRDKVRAALEQTLAEWAADRLRRK